MQDNYEKYLTMINELRNTEFTKEQFCETLKYINTHGAVWIAIIRGEIVATATILYEKKFMHNICIYAHIEDICVKPGMRRGGIGKSIIKKVMDEAVRNKCYKITLDCSDDNVQFYESCGLSCRGNQMCELIENIK